MAFSASSQVQGSPADALGAQDVTRGYNVLDLLVHQHDISQYVCPVCHLLLRNPVQSSCGDRMCTACLAALFKQDKSPVCPVDSIPLVKEDTFRDVFAEREVLSIVVYCPSRRHQSHCDWRGELRLLADHQELCLFAEVVCSLCSAKLLRQNMFDHERLSCPKRPLQCELCGHSTVADQLQVHQLQDCPNSRVPCPNNCGFLPTLRKEMNEHIRVCPNQTVLCYYETVGCPFRGARKDLPDHHASSLDHHLQATTQSFIESQKTTRQVQEENAALVKRCEELEKRFTVFTSQMEARLATLSRPFSFAGSAQSSSANCSEEESSAFSMTQSGPSLSLERRVASTERSLALHDIQMSEFNFRQDLQELKTTHGILVWKISNFARRTAEAKSGKTPSLYSPPFYTSPCGYKMCARLYPNGDGIGRGTHISLFFVMMKGEYDGLLSWPFQLKVTLSLLDQNRSNPRNVVETFRPDPRSSSFQRPEGEMNVASGCPLFLPQSAVSSETYSRNDTVFVKVVVHSANTVGPDAVT